MLAKSKAMDICLDNNIMEVLFRILENPERFNTNAVYNGSREDPDFMMAKKQLALLRASQKKEKENGTGKWWYVTHAPVPPCPAHPSRLPCAATDAGVLYACHPRRYCGC